MYNRAMVRLTATEARAALPEVLDRVERGEEVTITRHGRPVAVVVRPDALRSRRADTALADAAQIEALLAAGRASNLATAETLDDARADELIAEIRAGRRRR